MRESVNANRALRWCVVGIALVTGRLAGAQEPAPGGADVDVIKTPKPALAADIHVIDRLTESNQPVWIRFTLRNTSDDVVELPLAQQLPKQGGIALPTELILGTPDNPTLALFFQQTRPAEDRPVELVPIAEHEDRDGANILRLAPRGSVGQTVDLTWWSRGLRYPGEYRLEWRPLDGRLGLITASFRVEARKQAILVTDYGKITFSLMYDQAPRNVENFLDLVREGFYIDKTLHRIVPGFAIQGGCPKGDGTGIRPDGKLIPAEFHDAPMQRGTLAMARKPSEPDSASCQFFITLNRLPELDGEYTVIGQATDEESMRTLEQLEQVATDRRFKPLRSVSMRSIALVDAEIAHTSRFERQPVRENAGQRDLQRKRR